MQTVIFFSVTYKPAHISSKQTDPATIYEILTRLKKKKKLFLLLFFIFFSFLVTLLSSLDLRSETNPRAPAL